MVLSAALAPFAPLPYVVADANGARLVEHAAEATAKPFGRMCAFHGQMGMFVRAMSYMLAHGADGMRQASEDAVLNANYVKAGLKDLMSLPFGDRPCMHEVLFDDHWLEGTGVSTLDFAKAMIDEGYHPMTMYFPLVVHGAMLIEPTESESKASLDLFVAALRDLAMAAKRGDTARFSGAPYYAPRRRLDETRAARAAGAALGEAGAAERGGGVSAVPARAAAKGAPSPGPLEATCGPHLRCTERERRATPTTPCSSAPGSTGSRRPVSPHDRSPARRNDRRRSASCSSASV